MNFLNRFKSARNTHLMVLTLVGIAIMVNFLSTRHFFRVDLTQNQFYALTDASKEIMQELDDIVNVKVFFSKQLPPNLFVVEQYVDDMLEELSSYSKGNLSVEFLDPADPNIAIEAGDLGIPQIRMNIVEQDKIEVKNGYLGIAIVYGDRVEILPVVQNILNVEYDLVASIKKVTASEERRLGYVIGHGEPELTEQIGVGQLGNTYSMIKQGLDRNYRVSEVDLKSPDALEDIHTLLIAGAKTPFSDEEKYQIDQFILEGGNVALLLDTVDVDAGLSAEPLNLGLNEFMKHYGIEVGSTLVLDRSNEHASFNQGNVNFIVPYPFWVKAINQYFDPESPVVNQLDSFVLPWTSPLISHAGEGVDTTIMATTTENAWLQEAPFLLDPSAIQSPSERQKHVLVALASGRFESSYNEHELAEANESHLSDSSEESRLIVVGNSRFITDGFIQQFQQNLPFFMNMIDYLTLDESLITIRSKTSFDLPLKDLTARDRKVVKFFGILLMPVLVVAYGIFRYYSRKKKKFTF